MENATKALLIAAGVLIGVMILSLGIALFAELEAYVESSHDRMEANEKNAFNTQFTKYLNNEELKIQDVITAANLAFENNTYYDATYTDEDGSTMYVTVNLDNESIERDIQDKSARLLNDNIKNKYTCDIKISEKTGRVYKVNFNKIT